MLGNLLPFPQCLNLRDVFAATETASLHLLVFWLHSLRVRFLLGYFVLPVEQGCSIENGSAVTWQWFDSLVRKTASSRSAESFMRQAPSVHVRTASVSAPCRLGVPKRQGASARKGAQSSPGGRQPLISPSGGCRRRTASLPARSSAARAASRPARSSCPCP